MRLGLILRLSIAGVVAGCAGDVVGLQGDAAVRVDGAVHADGADGATGGAPDASEGARDAGGSVVDSGAPPMTLDAPTFCAAFDRAFLAAVAQCWGEDASTLARLWVGARACSGALEASVADGRVTFSSAIAARCLAAIERPDCGLTPLRGTGTRAAMAECAGLFTGTRRLGDDCRDDGECVAGAVCDTRTACPYTCVAPRLLGVGAECAPYAPRERCPAGSTCDRVLPDALYRCLPRAAVGAPCDGDTVCEGGACVGSVCVPAAEEGADCADRPCRGNHFCNLQSRCERLFRSGEACSTAGITLCHPLAYCADAPGPGNLGTCTRLPGVGEACAFDRPCVGGSCDYEGTLTCGARAPEGGACSDELPCAIGTCDRGLCATQPDPCRP